MLQPLLLCFHLVQGSRFRALVAASPPFLEDGILVSLPSPLGNAIKVSNPHFKWGFIWNPSGVLY